MKTRIISPIATGNGAYIVHKSISESLEAYSVVDLDPFTASLPIYKSSKIEKYDILHCIPDQGGLNKYGKIPTISTFHNFYTDRAYLKSQTPLKTIYYQSVLNWYIRYSSARSQIVTTVSNFLWKLVKDELGINSELIANGVDTKLFYPHLVNKSENDVFKILFAGNPTNRKGIETIRNLSEELPNNISISITSGARNLNYTFNSKRIKMIGKIPHDQMSQIYNEHDMLLLPSLREGLSLVILEAMACGLPIVTTDIPSNREAVAHKRGGFLFSLGNMNELASYLIKLSKNPDMCSDMGRHNRESVLKDFNSKTMCDSYSQLFKDAIEKS